MGDLANPANVSLLFPSGSNGVVVDEGSTLGYLGGMSLQGYGSGTDEIGVFVEENSMLTVGPLEIEGFSAAGIYVRDSSFLAGDPDEYSTDGWLTVRDGYYGVYVSLASGAMLPHLDVADSLYDGISATRTSYVYASESTVDSPGKRGIQAESGAFVDAESSTVFSSGTYSHVATYHAGMNAPYSTASGATYGLFADWNSTLVASSSTISSSTIPVYSSAESLIHVGSSTVSTGSGASYMQQLNALILANSSSAGTVSSSNNETTDFVYGK